MSDRTSIPRFARRALGTALAAALVAPMALMTAAAADTPNAGTTTVASTSSQANVPAVGAAGGTLTGLTNGEAVTVQINAPTGSFFGADARLCRTGVEINSVSRFDPTATGNCIDAPMNAQSDDFVHADQDVTNSFTTLVFRVGVGTNTVEYGGTFTRDITCGPGNPCTLWIAQLHTANNYVHYNLEYATPATNPDPPTVTSVAGVESGTITVAPPANTGNRPIDQYTVILTGGPGAGTQIVTPPANTATFTGLTSGTPYSATATARNTAGLTSAASAPTTFTPLAPAARRITQTITVTRPTGALVLTQICGNNAARTGPPVIGANTQNGPAGRAPEISPGVPDPRFVDPGYPNVVDDNGDSIANYPTNCAINLGQAKPIKSGPNKGKFFQAKGYLNQVTVVDTRVVDAAWTATGTMGDFVNTTAGHSFGGDQLGWTPIATGEGVTTFADGTTYTHTVNRGDPVPANTAGGLGNGEPLASTVSGASLGVATLDADLDLLMPVNTKLGNYVGVLTITVA